MVLLNSRGQQVVIVKDAESDSTLNGATIQCEDGFAAVLNGNPVSIAGKNCMVRFQGFEQYYLTQVNPVDSIYVYLRPKSTVLSAVTITGFAEQQKLTETAGGYALLNKRSLQAFQEVSPLPAFNAVPGVRMEQRSPGSYRFNIRGSTLRAPFGVRNVKVYWNNIPFTEPTGSTPVNMLDFTSIDRAEIIRGPAGSTYGAGIGGVIMLQELSSAPEGIGLFTELAGGSYGLIQTNARFSQRNDNSQVNISGNYLRNDGYREHSSVERKNVTVGGNINLASNQVLGYSILYSDLKYDLPGGLTADQRDEDPGQARALSASQDARIDQDYILAGFSYTYTSELSRFQSSIFFSGSDKENPFVTNYEYEKLSGAGVRLVFNHRFGNVSPVYLTAGGEWQRGRQKAENFGNRMGNPDTLRYVDDNTQFTGFEFVRLAFRKNNWDVTAGTSFNHLDYEFDRIRDVGLDSSYQVARSFPIVVSPRLAVTRSFGPWAAHASFSVGFSPPTLDEIRTSDGEINEDLEAERGQNLEAGLRGNFLNNRLTLDITLFQLWQRNTIVSQVTEGGVSTFSNSGETSQRGMELFAGYELINRPGGWLRVFDIQSAVTLNHFRFTDYVRASGGENVDYSGNQLTGSPSTMISSAILLQIGQSVTWEIRHLYVDRIPLNDANSVFGEAYHLVNMRIAWESSLDNSWKMTLFGGVDNLLNQKYSLGNDLNAFGSRYFNPAAPVNFYGGVRVNFNSP